MSSEAAAYFPDALASAPHERGSDHQAPGIQVGFLEGVQSGIEPVERRLHFVEEVAESSDETLLKQVREGAQEALAFLFRRHARAALAKNPGQAARGQESQRGMKIDAPRRVAAHMRDLDMGLTQARGTCFACSFAGDNQGRKRCRRRGKPR